MSEFVIKNISVKMEINKEVGKTVEIEEFHENFI